MQHVAAFAARPGAWGRMPDAEPADHGAFDQLRNAIAAARRRRTSWALAVIAGVILAAIAGFSAWSDAVGALFTV